jgi:hypothetical protein
MSDTGTMNNVNNIGYLNYAGLEALVDHIKNRYDGTVASIEKGTTEKDANVYYFKAVNGANVCTLDTTDFIKDGMLSDVKLITNASGKSILRFIWNIYAGDNVQDLKTIDIPVEDFINTGTVTDLQTSVNELSGKVDGFEGTVNALNTSVNTLSGKVDDFENTYLKQESVIETSYIDDLFIIKEKE